MPLRQYVAFFALTRTREESPVWQRVEPQARPFLEADETYAPEEPVQLPRRPADAGVLMVFVSGLVTYDIGVTVGPVVHTLSRGTTS
jgi:hypothetical protein